MPAVRQVMRSEHYVENRTSGDHMDPRKACRFNTECYVKKSKAYSTSAVIEYLLLTTMWLYPVGQSICNIFCISSTILRVG
jgi:hypothetical protein